MYKHIYIKVKHLLSNDQHGFVEKRSTVTNLSCFSQFATEILDQRGQLDVIYTDFSKAFDRVDHGILLTKLHSSGFSFSLLTLIKSYLLRRDLFVCYGGQKSDTFSPTSGVPQGSNLGPLLFLLFINDITTKIDSNILIYADDIKIYLPISHVKDSITLQKNLNSIYEWSVINRIELNIPKCKVVTFTRKTNSLKFNYMIESTLIARSNRVKDLGIHFDGELSFSEHISNTIINCNKTMGFIFRNCKDFNNINTIKILFLALVRSKLDYTGIVWHPIYNKSKNDIENIQRRFLKYLWLKKTGNYPERGFPNSILLNAFSIKSLELRHSNSTLSFLYKLLYHKIDCPYLLNKLEFLIPSKCTRNVCTFYTHTPKTNILKKSLIHKMSTMYNNLDK